MNLSNRNSEGTLIMECRWLNHVEKLHSLLSTVSFQNERREEITPDEGFELWWKITLLLRQQSGVVFLIGNGASASMASHFAADLAKNAQVHTQVFSDLSLITAISNDVGYEYVFEEPLKRRGCAKDLLVAISSSGNSPNILRAARWAKSIGMKIVTLSGFSPANPLRNLGFLNLFVPGKTYGQIETCHSTLLHHWMDLMADPDPASAC